MKSSTPPSHVRFRFRLSVANHAEFVQLQPTESIASLVGSSAFAAIADDALKDEDNAGWVMQLEASVQQEWVKRIRWIRLVDRLAESGLGHTESTEFQTFLQDWQRLYSQGALSLNSPFALMLREMRDRWFDPQGQLLNPAVVQAWGRYITAMATYNHSNLVIETCGDYEQLLNGLAGSFFQVLPFLADHHRNDARQFGIVDQFYNHLRDLQEDISHGICYFPEELLIQFGVSREEFFQARVLHNPNYFKMMQFWLDVYLPRLRRRVRPLIMAKDLHPSWQILCDWSLHRYRRIEQVFRECEFDYVQFSRLYWKRVRSELPIMLDAVYKHQSELTAATPNAPELNFFPLLRSPASPSSYTPRSIPAYSTAMSG
jgi:phytoene synthase